MLLTHNLTQGQQVIIPGADKRYSVGIYLYYQYGIGYHVLSNSCEHIVPWVVLIDYRKLFDV